MQPRASAGFEPRGMPTMAGIEIASGACLDFSDVPTSMKVRVNGAPDLTPRAPAAATAWCLTSVPYALRRSSAVLLLSL